MKEFRRLIPFNCRKCKIFHKPKDMENRSLCISYYGIVCPKCSQGSKISVCQPCISMISKRFETPQEYYRQKHRGYADVLNDNASQGNSQSQSQTFLRGLQRTFTIPQFHQRL